MSNEELNKKIEFIIEQQAKFVVDLDVLREVQAASSRSFSDALFGMLSVVGNLTQAQVRTEESVKLLSEAQTRTDESIQSLTESQKRTDERLNIFINVVERYMSGNGGSERHA